MLEVLDLLLKSRVLLLQLPLFSTKPLNQVTIIFEFYFIAFQLPLQPGYFLVVSLNPFLLVLVPSLLQLELLLQGLVFLLLCFDLCVHFLHMCA